MTLTNVTVSDPSAAARSAGPPATANTDGKLQTTETWTYTGSYTVTQADINAGGNLTNTVTVDSADQAPTPTRSAIPITQEPALTGRSSRSTTTAGDRGGSAGAVHDHGHQHRQPDPDQHHRQRSQCSGPISGPAGDSNTDGKLQTTETWTYTCSHTVTQAEIDAGGNLTNTVTADSAESAPTPTRSASRSPRHPPCRSSSRSTTTR